jgi:DNA invertase Pin-like site-specific DNA recombinase
LTKLKEQLRKGDTLVIWRLDRLARSLKDLIEWVAYPEKESIALKSIKENIDTSTPTGRLVRILPNPLLYIRLLSDVSP